MRLWSTGVHGRMLPIILTRAAAEIVARWCSGRPIRSQTFDRTLAAGDCA